MAVAAGTGDVLMARLREGRANTARGAAHFLRETVSRVRYGGASGQLTMRADSGFYTHAVVAVCRRINSATPSPSASTKACTISSRRYPKMHADSLLDGRCCPPPIGRDHLHPLPGRGDAAPVRLIVRRVKPTPGSQLALFAKYSYHGFITDRDGELLELEADHRRHAEIENAIRDLKYGVGLSRTISPRAASPPTRRCLWPTTWPAGRQRIGLGERIATTKTLRRRFFGRTAHPLGTDPASSGSPLG